MPLQCCTNDAQMLRRSHPNCCAIEIPPMDPFYSQFSRRCMDMVRSEILDSSACSENDILQIIMVSHYQDMSFTYGSTEDEMNSLRTFSGGEMKAKILPGWKGGESRMFMPNNDKPMENCFVRSENEPCYKAGDGRVNENLGLAGLQTLLLREHNRVARILQEMHPYWDDETLFQETKRILIAEWQYITFNDFLPKIIEEGFTDVYIPEVDSSTMNEFTAAAFRFPHSLIQGTFELTSEKRCPFKSYWLRDFYMRPGKIEKGDNLDALLRGTSTQACQAPDRHFVKDITLFLMRNRLPFGDDLEATDVQRGRDHGLPSYNDMRFYCGLRRATIFEDFLDVMSEKNVLRLKSLYRHVDAVDFFVGGSLEFPGVMGDSNALVGHTFGCVIGEQFWRWKFGDRHFFDLIGQAGSFTLEQINGIKKTSLSAMMCENLSIKFIQRDAFLQVFQGNELKNCNDIEKMDLSGWINFTPSDACGAEPV
ncbi:hypothetical protein J437_LFUL006904 [Ladona fulva]|uniref:Peroxidase n=1 Tax=Ladona fulva TaxID=123851 RepID=A0A8K0K2Q9_LADFU|nr:hypothetical protein J437_LFUL006904 [Ladona fulva]